MVAILNQGTTMKILSKIFLILLLTLSHAFASNMQNAVMNLQKIHCYGCMITVQKALQKVPGVEEAKVDFEQKIATVRFDPTKTNPQALMQATADAGFPSTIRK
jgi:mercuric ion binding protein